MDCPNRESPQDVIIQNFCMFKFEDEDVLNRNSHRRKSKDPKVSLDLFNKLGGGLFSQGQSIFIQNSKMRS